MILFQKKEMLLTIEISVKAILHKDSAAGAMSDRTEIPKAY